MENSKEDKIVLIANYADQQSRALMIFCKFNSIPYKIVSIKNVTEVNLTEEFTEMNSLEQIPAIKADINVLFGVHTIMKYLHSTRNWADHWYPVDAMKRAKVDMYLEFYHRFLKQNSADVLLKLFHGPFAGKIFNQHEIRESKRALFKSLDMMDSLFLASSPYLCGEEITIADISSYWEILQLDIAGVDISKFENIEKW